MLTIKFDNGNEQQHRTTEEAEQAIQDIILNNDNINSAELLQDGQVVAIYTRQDFQ